MLDKLAGGKDVTWNETWNWNREKLQKLHENKTKHEAKSKNAERCIGNIDAKNIFVVSIPKGHDFSGWNWPLIEPQWLSSGEHWIVERCH